MFEMRVSSGTAAAVTRATEAMLRALGGEEVSLLFPKAVAPDDPGAQLGMVAPGIQQITVEPVGVRSRSAEARDGRLRFEFLFPASSIAPQQSDDSASAQAFFEGALGIAHRGRLLRVEAVETETIGGVAYLYRVTAAE